LAIIPHADEATAWPKGNLKDVDVFRNNPCVVISTERGNRVPRSVSRSDLMTQSPFAAVILAAGGGTRMNSAVPKVMQSLREPNDDLE